MFSQASVILLTGGCVVLFRGACMVLFGGACMVLFGGRAWFYLGCVRGFIHGACMVLFGGACMVLFGGHAWFYSGACMVLFGGACMVLSGRHVWFYSGEGVHGFIWGGMHGFIRGGGMRGFSSLFGYNEIRSMSGRYVSYWNAFLLIDLKFNGFNFILFINYSKYHNFSCMQKTTLRYSNPFHKFDIEFVLRNTHFQVKSH